MMQLFIMLYIYMDAPGRKKRRRIPETLICETKQLMGKRAAIPPLSLGARDAAYATTYVTNWANIYGL